MTDFDRPVNALIRALLAASRGEAPISTTLPDWLSGEE